MATLNTTVQSVIDSMYTKMQAGTLTAEEQMLVGKGLEALMSNASWEKALIAVAEDNISEARGELQAAKTELTESIAQIKQHYSPLIAISSYAHIATINAGKSLVITPPSGSRIRVFQLIALGTNQSSLGTYNYVVTTLGDRQMGTRVAGSQAASAAFLKVGISSVGTSSFSATSGSNSYKELLGQVDEKLTLKNVYSSTAYILVGVDFVTGDY